MAVFSHVNPVLIVKLIDVDWRSQRHQISNLKFSKQVEKQVMSRL